jgi:HK97 family phage portal protein
MSELQVIRRAVPSRWSRLRQGLRSFWTGPLTAGSIEGWLFGGGQTSTGVTVSEETALTYAAFWSAVTRISADVASLPLILYKRDKTGAKQRFTDHPLYWLLHDEPNPEMSAMVFRETLQAHVLTWGNGYAEIERNGAGRPYALWPLAPTRVSPFRPSNDPYGPLRYRVSNPSGGDTILRAEDVLHIPGLGYDGSCGYSVVGKARESLGLGLATQQFGATFFGNGATFGGVFSHPTTFAPGAEETFKKAINNNNVGVDKAHRYLVVQEGMTYTALGVPPNDAQFLETRKFQIAEVARWFNIPAHKLGDLEHATFSNIEHMAIEYVQDTLRPWLVRWEQECNRKLIAPQEKGIQYTEHLMDALLRGDIQSRYNAYAVGRQWGWLSSDDVRAFENMNPLPGGQGTFYLVPQNMWPADKIDEMLKAQTAKAAPQPAAPMPADDEPARAVLAVLEQRLGVADASVAHARAEADQQRTRCEALEQRLASTDAEILEARRQEGELRERVAQIQLLADGLRVERDTVAADLRQTTDRQVEEAALRARLEAEQAAAVAAQHDADQHVAEARTAAEQADEARREAEAAAQSASDKEGAAVLRVVALDADLARMTGRVTALEATLEEQRQTAEQAHATVIAHQVREQETSAALVALETALDRATQERADVETAIRTAAVVDTQRTAAIVAAHRTLVVDVMRRMIERETDRARRQQGSPDKMRTWMETFYPAHESLCITALKPAIAVHLAWMGRSDDVDDVTRRYVRDHITESMHQLHAVIDGGADELGASLYGLFQRWEAERAHTLADRLFQEEIAHVTRRPS